MLQYSQIVYNWVSRCKPNRNLTIVIYRFCKNNVRVMDGGWTMTTVLDRRVGARVRDL